MVYENNKMGNILMYKVNPLACLLFPCENTFLCYKLPTMRAKHFNAPKTQCCMPESGWIPASNTDGEGLLERATPLPCLTPEGLGSPCSTINLVSKPSFLLYKLVCICVTLLTTGMFIWRERYMDHLMRTKAVSFSSPHPQRILING